MSNIDKLRSKFDVEDLDAAQITKAISEHQNSIIKLVLIIGTLVLVVLMFNDHQRKELDLHHRMSQVQDKLDAIKARQKAIEDLVKFRSSLPPKLNEIELISLISNYAISCHITIASLSPAESRDMGLYDLININFNAQSANFKNMMLFIRKIEISKFPLRVDSWSGNEQANGQVTFTVILNAVLIHK